MTKRLHFYPFYEDYLKNKFKHTTVKLGWKEHFKVGQKISLTTGWYHLKKRKIRTVGKGILTKVLFLYIDTLNENDLIGESPDCRTQEALRLTLSAIYRKVVQPDDKITLIEWEYE